MNREELGRTIRELIAVQNGTDAEAMRGEPDSATLDDCGLTSLDFIPLVVDIEESLNIDLPDSVLEGRTIGGLVDAVYQVMQDERVA